jgi:Pvc16 N-terminal domain
MIQDVDESLRTLIRRDALAGMDIEVLLDAPTREWSARRNSPTLDLYLYDIREDLRRRETGLIETYDEAGHVKERRRPPRYYKLSYLVTAWTQRPEDEHLLLSAVLLCLLRHDHLPLDVLGGSLARSMLPVPVTVALPPPDDRALSDVWSALGGELKPSLDLVVIPPFEAGPVEHAAKLVREGVRLNFAMSDHDAEKSPSAGVQARPFRGGRARKGRGSGVEESQAGGPESVVGGTRDEKGRIFRLRDMTHAPKTYGETAGTDGGQNGGTDGGPG